jgi:hypothetical protein
VLCLLGFFRIVHLKDNGGAFLFELIFQYQSHFLVLYGFGANILKVDFSASGSIASLTDPSNSVAIL